MSKRKLVPAALHSELTEYSSLIRALRTSNTLDVTSHITKLPEEVPRQLDDDDDELNSNDDDEESEQGEEEIQQDLDSNDDFETPTIPPSTACDSRDISPHLSSPPSPSGGPTRKRKRILSSSPPPRKRDTWTRWPLLIGDVHVPEWTLEDEIGLLAADTLKRRPHPPLPIVGSHADDSASDEDEDEDEDDQYGDPSVYLPHLTNVASNHLSTILALLVAHTPNRPHAQQNRIEPMGWRAVLDVLSACGDPSVADPTMINSVKTRMEALYGPATTAATDESASEVLAAHRIQCSISAKEKLKAQITRPMESLLSLPTPPKEPTPPPRRSTRQTRASARLAQKAVADG
ncbi:hypothetical protein Hypma_009460 [Hypsizygus marmoreus]|uniref:Uncharacterized protein n=1 Tax=Hypsizygus marmoreus TaxID=39966 RepID=A0A369JNB6_HYPMA|nr:hypothetical protein Hypma_009460 [Hypsizygus marmoreus]